jgi:hypothetical protein
LSPAEVAAVSYVRNSLMTDATWWPVHEPFSVPLPAARQARKIAAVEAAFQAFNIA